MLTEEITVTLDLRRMSPEGNINRRQDQKWGGSPQFTSASIVDGTSVGNVENAYSKYLNWHEGGTNNMETFSLLSSLTAKNPKRSARRSEHGGLFQWGNVWMSVQSLSEVQRPISW